MELQQIVDRYAEAIEHLDASVSWSGANPRTGLVYRVGFKSLDEKPAVTAIDTAWASLHDGELLWHRTGVPYPTISRTACDHVLTTDDLGGAEEEWGIEVKRLQFVGDNGKANDFAVTKTLSPYLKDRGLLHDAVRLREHGFTRRVAVIGYAFDYNQETLRDAELRHPDPDSQQVIADIRQVVVRNGGQLTMRPLIEFADAILGLRGLTTGPRAQRLFEAWRHPAGGRGIVFGWEIRRPQRESDYDSRHPW